MLPARRRFILGPSMSVADLTDGTSTTAAVSEQLLGIPGPYSQTTPDPIPSPAFTGDGTNGGRPPDRRGLRRGPGGWLLNKGAGWWDGNYLNTLYNHHETPNSAHYDCITYHNPGWKAARSQHPGGVNVLFCDGHVGFVRKGVASPTWRAIATRPGGEVVSSDAFLRQGLERRLQPKSGGATHVLDSSAAASQSLIDD